MSDWVSVDDRLPDEDVEVLVIDGTGEYWIATQHNTFFTDCTHEHVGAAYWMPLPEFNQ